MWEAVEDELEVFEESEGVLALLQAGLGHVDSLCEVRVIARILTQVAGCFRTAIFQPLGSIGEQQGHEDAG